MTSILIGGQLLEVPEKEIEKLQKKYGEKGKWKPELGMEYWFIDYYQTAVETCWENDTTDNRNIKTFNCFKTKEQAQAKLDLINHIAEFDEPEKIDRYYYYDTLGWREINSFKDLEQEIKPEDIALFQTGFVMNIKSTKKDRDKRESLLKAVYS